MNIVNRINNPIIVNSKAIEIGRFELLTTERMGETFQRKQFRSRAFLNLVRKFFELSLSTCCYADSIIYLCDDFFKDFRKERKGFVFSMLHFVAIAKSIISFLKWLSLTMVSKKIFCSSCGNARKAVINISAVACLEVIFLLPLFCKVSIT